MAIPWYPIELPAPERAGYQFAYGDGRSASRNDAGPPSPRQRFSAVGDPISLQTQLARSELARFDRFFNEETRKGSRAFFMRDPLTDGWPALTAGGEPIVLPSGAPMLLAKTLLCLFGQGLPVTTPLPNSHFFMISFSVVVLP